MRLLVSVLLLGGCMADGTDPEVPDDDAGGKADSARLAPGTYELTSPARNEIHIRTMVLLGTRFRNEVGIANFSLDLKGTYKLSRLQASGERLLRMTVDPADAEDTEPQEKLVLAYEIAPDKTITFIDRSEDPDPSFTMKPASALWCATAADCLSQRFTPSDGGQITCTQNRCGSSMEPTDCRTDGCSKGRVCRQCGAPPRRYTCTFADIAC